MGVFDWLGPLGWGGKARSGWDALPVLPARKSAFDMYGAGTAALTVRTLVHGPGTPPWTPDGYGGAGAAENSAVFACLQAIAEAIGEPPLKVYRTTPSGRVEVDGSPLGDLLRRPNPCFTLDALLAYVATCLSVDGNAYWRKLRAGDPETGNVVELWPISPTRIGPYTADGTNDFISAYRYHYASGKYVDLSTSNVVHFRLGIDDADHRRGVSPLRRLAREVSSDEQATRYADRLLANMTINGLTLSFDKESPPISQDVADELKARISAAYGGDSVGSTAVLSPGATLQSLGFSPEQMDLATLHRVPEERICADLGVPAAMIGLGVGLEHAIYNNVEQAEEHFTERKLIPLWKGCAATLTLQLVPDFTSDPAVCVEFDTSEVRALATDQDALAVRLKTLVETGIISVDEARAEIGLEPRGGADGVPTRAPTPAPGPTVLPTAASARPRHPNAGAPPRSARPPQVVTLGARREQKAAADLPGEYADLRDGSLPDWVDALVAFFVGQLRRTTRRLSYGADTADDLMPETEALRLATALRPLQLDVLDATQGLVIVELGVAFGLDDSATRQFLRNAGANIVGITDTTREQVRAELIAGQQAGEGIPELARRLRDLPTFGQNRATVVARTELGTSQNQAALSSYRASGVVVGVRVHDGDYDEACAAMDGRTFPLGQEPAMLQHPQCTRALAPITDSAELQAAS